MIFKSEITGKEYKTAEECLEAERKFQAQTIAKENALKNERKKYAYEVANAQAEVDAAYANLDKAKEEIKKILEESNKKMEDIMKAADAKVKAAKAKELQALKEFTGKFGPYSKTVTGAEAEKEFNRYISLVDGIFSQFFGI